jgi:predicted DNA-binding protein (MmcQ/YjbR family)
VAAAKKSAIPAEKLAVYERLIATNPDIERKGDVHPYTSHNGHMFTYLDQTGALGIRLPKEEVDAFLKKYKTTLFVSYGVVKKDWVTVPDTLLKDTKTLKKYLEISYEYVQTLKPK